MAKPIKDTPELFGEDARRFEELISTPRPVSKEDRERAMKAYDSLEWK